MLLLDLPPEIFQRVVHELVLDVGINEAWKLRGVSRTFASEIHHDIFAYQPKETLIAHLSRNRYAKILENNFPLYIRNRMNTGVDSDGVLVFKVKALLDYLMKELHIQDFERRQHYAAQLSEGILRFGGDPWNRVQWTEAFVWGQGTYQNFTQAVANKMKLSPATAAEKLCAAVAVNAYDLVPSLFEQSEDPSNTHFVPPLVIAVKKGDVEMSRTLLECYKKSYPQRNARRDKFTAILVAIEANSVEALKLLLHSCKSWDRGQETEKSMRQQWMNKAAATGSVALLEAIIEMKGGRKRMLTQEVVKSICGYGTVPLINHYIGTGLLDVNKTWSHTSPLVAATEEPGFSGNERIPALVLAGADINKATGDGSTALFAALKHSAIGTVNYLLNHGADTNTESWPRYFYENTLKRRLQRILAGRAKAQLSATQTRNA